LGGLFGNGEISAELDEILAEEDFPRTNVCFVFRSRSQQQHNDTTTMNTAMGVFINLIIFSFYSSS